MSTYSWRDFGREAEYLVASYLRKEGWRIVLSPSSRGAADLIAKKDGNTWCIQVKASMKSPHIKSEEIIRLQTYARSIKGVPVFASVQPWRDDKQYGASIGSYMIFLYSTDNWQFLQP
jgi:Holliday junction resolvase